MQNNFAFHSLVKASHVFSRHAEGDPVNFGALRLANVGERGLNELQGLDVKAQAIPLQYRRRALWEAEKSMQIRASVSVM